MRHTLFKLHLLSGVFAIIGLLVFAGCDSQDDPASPGTDPEIINLRTGLRWNLAGQQAQPVEVEVKDPQGPDNIRGVYVEIRDASSNLVLSDSLYDDGGYFYPAAGDAFARDGIFRNQFVPASIDTAPGFYSLKVTTEDLEGHAAVPVERELQFGYSYPVEFRSFFLPQRLESGSDDIIVTAEISHPKGNDVVNSISLILSQLGQSAPLAEYPLYDDGDRMNHGDAAAGDSIYSFRMDSAFAVGRIGDHVLQLAAVNDFDETSLSSAQSFFIENEAGIIIRTFVPDSIARPVASGGSSVFLVQARVKDAQSLADVDEVSFKLQRPDGTYGGNGSAFPLFDTGEEFYGDDVAGDGIYSVLLQLDQNAQLGRHYFEFNMSDRAENQAAVKIDSLEVF